jgi:hypothetical protein
MMARDRVRRHFSVTALLRRFEALEDAFCFSVYLDDNRELWFQFTLEQAEQIVAGTLVVLDVRSAECWGRLMLRGPRVRAHHAAET